MLTLISVVFVYGILFMDWGEMAGREVAPFAGVRVAIIGTFIRALIMYTQVREWFHETINSIWTSSPKPRLSPTMAPSKDDPLPHTKR